jgi:hypothetical protein
MLMPYFGQWPEWIDLFMWSCARNPNVQWHFFTDCGELASRPANVTLHPMTWEQCACHVQRVCGLRAPPARPYKLCDFRFAYGHLFADYVAGYDFWGFGDVDVIYGDLQAFWTPTLLSHDLVTFNRTHVSGHLTLVRNTPEAALRYRESAIWREGIEDPRTRLLEENSGYYGFKNVYADETYNTPLSPYIPWTDGSFRFPAVWYYRDGWLGNNLGGARSWMYLHFMRYKQVWLARGLRRVVHLPSNSPETAWKLTLDGFHPLEPGDESRAGKSVLAVRPVAADSGL